MIGTYNIVEGCISKHCKLTIQGVSCKHLILEYVKAEIIATVNEQILSPEDKANLFSYREELECLV